MSCTDSPTASPPRRSSWMGRGAWSLERSRVDAADSGCDFAETRLLHADGSVPGEAVRITLNLLVRIWRRLGRPLAETDRLASVFAGSTSEIGAAIRRALVGIAYFARAEERL